MITASKLARLLACPSSEVLSKAENHSDDAEAGREAHADFAHLDKLPDNLRKHVPPGSRSEVKLAYDVATREGRIIGEGGGREYGTPTPFEILGSTDVLGRIGDDAVIIDWKSGLEVEPADRNPQLLFYALAACRALRLDSAILRIVYTRLNKVDEAYVGPLELAAFANRLAGLHGEIARRRSTFDPKHSDTVEGSHCKWCPSKHVCPSKTALLAKFANANAPTPGLELMPLNAQAAYRQIQAVDQLVIEAKKRLATYVDEHGPIDLGDGVLYGRYTRPGNEELDAEKTSIAIYGMLTNEQAEEFESIAIEKSTTKAAIKRAAQVISPDGGATKLAERVIEQIRKLGGSTHKAATRPLGEYKAKDKTKEKAINGQSKEEINFLLKATS